MHNNLNYKKYCLALLWCVKT